jgi:hypothetical protein
MRKLTLKLDELQVESFTTAPSSANRGTVRAHGETDLRTCACPSDGCTWGGCPGSFDCTDPSMPDCGTVNSCEMNNCGTLIQY